MSQTLVHEDIIYRGIIRSVTKYLQDQKTPGAMKVRNRHSNHIETHYYKDPKHLYQDYYDKWICELELEFLIKTDFQRNVAVVDFDENTKDLPYAHFDAETFKESNQRVIEYTKRIYKHLDAKEYHQARKLTGQILHTIQDFYSHSNWVEMGNTHINSAIGSQEFNKLAVASRSDNLTCVSNCTLTTVKCNIVVETLMFFLKSIAKFENTHYTCPLRYFKCEGNIVALDRLVSGYYVHQKLPNDVGIEKPNNTMKCSHGGIVDSDSFKPAMGGINKDSGFYLFSPHANLHLAAAKLAIKHTEHYFNEIRKKIGDDEFNHFLKIKLSDSFINTVENALGICSGAISNLKHSSFYFLSFMFIYIFIFLI